MIHYVIVAHWMMRCYMKLALHYKRIAGNPVMSYCVVLTRPHFSTIVAAAQLLPGCPNHAHLATLSDWLNALNLSYLEAKFIINGYGNLKRVTQLQPWDIDLMHVSNACY